jgi:hypothetical protein
MATTLPTATSLDGAQSTTQDPQTATSGASFGFTGQQTSSVQPGTSNSILENDNGTKLNNVNLATIPLNSSTSTAQTSQTATQQRHINGGLLIIVAILIVLAIGSFVAINHSAKSTTQYS